MGENGRETEGWILQDKSVTTVAKKLLQLRNTHTQKRETEREKSLVANKSVDEATEGRGPKGIHGNGRARK